MPKNASLRPWLRWLPAVALMLTIFIASSIPDTGVQTAWRADPLKIPSFGTFNALFKKSAHLLVYALLARFYLYALGADTAKNRRLALLFTFLYGLSDELHQIFTPTRGPSILDVLIDGTGGWLALYLLPRFINPRQSKPKT